MNRWRDRSAEKGSILMITLIMLLVATMIGMMAITTSTTGISMMGNYKTASQTFYTTDSATKWALTNPSTFAMNLYAAPLSAQTFTDPGIPGWLSLGGFYTNASGQARVTYLSTGAPPAGTSARYFQTNYFMIQTTGNGGANNAQDTHHIYFASTVAKDCGQSC